LPKPLTLDFGVHQLEMGDHRLGPGRARLRLLARGTLGQQGAAKRTNVIRQGFGRRHVE
jgi:hypothetical protein